MAAVSAGAEQAATETPPRPAASPALESAREVLAFGLGSNAGDSLATLRWALEELRRLHGPLEVAPLYRAAPISPIPQPDFLNSVALAALPPGHAFTPATVLERIKALERRAGRRPGARFGPRPLDVDLLLFGDLVQGADGGDLILPHPRMRLRRFVLAPLNDLAPDLALPPDGAAVGKLLAALGDGQRVEKIAWSPA